MSIYLTETNNLKEIAELASKISDWHSGKISAGDRVPDFWDECEVSDKLAQFLINGGYKCEISSMPQTAAPQAPAAEADSTKEAAEMCQHTYTTRKNGENIQVYCTKCGAFTEFTRDGIEQPPKV